MEFMIIFLSLTIAMIVPLIISNIKLIAKTTIVASIINFVMSVYFIKEVKIQDSIQYFNNLIYIDSLSIIQLFIITTVTSISAIYSYKYILKELREEEISLRRAKIFYVLFNAFVFSMFVISLSNNVMLMWVGLEGTTIATAFLIGFNKNKLALEAAWKYIILCSIGIGIGLIGIILLLFTTGFEAQNGSLNWTTLLVSYNTTDLKLTKIAFTLIFVGIGTKAGFAPMHTWLSDGHSEAPSPVSAMMSGILLNLALYVIVRFYVIVKRTKGVEDLKYLFIIFAIISLVIATFSMLRQTNYKRLLAYSSVENIGIISLGIGIGGYLGVLGALIHSIIHAFGKTALFLTAGNILSVFKSKRIGKIQKLIKTMPKNAVLLMLGMLIITGAPPFASFYSEFNILIQGIEKGHYIFISIYLLCILIAFAAFLNIFIKMVFVKGEAVECERFEEDEQNIAPIILSLFFAILVTPAFKGYLYPILEKSVRIICG